MAPLVVQLVVTVVARWFVPWRDATRIGLAVMFLFTAGSHFSTLKYDLAAMIPPPLTGALWVIYVTGVLEAAGAIGLLTRLMRGPATWGLIALLVGLFPANLYAAMTGVTVGGASATPLLLRTPLQLLWIGLLWWSTNGRRSAQLLRRSEHGAQVASVLFAGLALVGCTTPPSPPAAAAPEQSPAIEHGLGERVDALIADLRAREDENRRQQIGTVPSESIATTSPSAPIGAADYRQASVPPAATAAVQTSGGTKTTLEEMREEASVAFETRLAELGRRQTALNRSRQEADAACSGTTSGTSLGAIIGTTQGSIPPTPAPVADVSLTVGNIEIANDTTPRCRSMRAGVRVEEAEISAALDALETDARRLGIYPGVMRDLFGKYQLSR